MFNDRVDAALDLAEKLEEFREKDIVVLAIPRGGLPLGAIIARRLSAPLDVSIVKKIGHPENKEYAIGALNIDGYFINPTGENVPQSYIEEETRRVRELVEKRHREYYSKTRPHDLQGKWVIVVDDGIATGSTVLATVELAAGKDPAGIIIATPVAPPRTVEKLQASPHVDRVISLEIPDDFRGVGQFYKNFEAVSDEEAISLLEKANEDQ